MLGDRNVRGIVDKAFDRLYQDLGTRVDRGNSDRIHALEASLCTRLAYYERKDPLPPDNVSKISIVLGNGVRRAAGASVRGEYRVDSLTLDAEADMLAGEGGEFVVHFEVVPALPEVPHPRDLLYLNACLFALNKNDGLLVYMTAEGRTVEFSLTKSNRMFEETIRRARVLSTLLKDGKVPIVEPSDLCLRCRYYSRCYAREKLKEDGNSDMLAELFGKIKPK